MLAEILSLYNVIIGLIALGFSLWITLLYNANVLSHIHPL